MKQYYGSTILWSGRDVSDLYVISFEGQHTSLLVVGDESACRPMGVDIASREDKILPEEILLYTHVFAHVLD